MVSWPVLLKGGVLLLLLMADAEYSNAWPVELRMEASLSQHS